MKHAERGLHIAIADYLRLTLPPEVVWTHFPAGEKRSAVTGALLKRMGLKAGVTDFLLWWDGRSYAIEVKVPGGHISAAQNEMHQRLVRAGVQVCIAYRLEAVSSFLESVGIPLKVKV